MPRPTGLTAERVIDAAVALADEIGIERFTIRRLADALGTKPMTLYHHVPNKDAIVDGMVDRVFAEILDPPEDLPWLEAVAQRCRSARAVLATHPWATPLMESRTNPGPNLLGHHDAVLACLRRGGLTWSETATAYALLDAFVYGFALQEANLPATAGDDMVDLATSVLDAGAGDFAAAYPSLAAFTGAHVLAPGYDFGDEFDRGLAIVLDGIARR